MLLKVIRDGDQGDHQCLVVKKPDDTNARNYCQMNL